MLVRKAYKKLALKTHPDRLPQGATASDKAASEEMFRQVNNAYEVLSDEQNRRVYDQHGVWPPPEPTYENVPPRSGPSRHNAFHRDHHYSHRPFPGPFDDPFLRGSQPFFTFTDPFTLFDSIFGAPNGMHHRARQYEPRAHRYEPVNPFEQMQRMHAEVANMMMGMDRDMFNPYGTGFSAHSAGDAPGGSGMQWASESHMVSSVNGVTQSITKRRDWDGNEHVTRTLPNGREIHTINGLEQPPGSMQALPYNTNPQPITASQSLPHHTRGDSRHRHAPPPVGQIHSTGGARYSSPPPLSPYPGNPVDYSRNEYNSSPQSRRHDRRHSDARPVVPEPYNSHPAPVIPPSTYDVPHDEHHHKRRWWRGGW
ncbi:hypothetical protein HGRIS_004744 [Hohenbuehelia grisea]|uniref:J domain-containing protein n=1 Tax=Hohenbuehelia grisea TaxID=104357 RepID=A0ABR3JCV0_9AGAR